MNASKKAPASLASEARCVTIGFDEDAHLDEGSMWPTADALTTLAPADVTRIAGLVRKAVG